MSKLALELNARKVVDPSAGRRVMVTPPLHDGYWLARVPVGRKGKQAVVCFPKFGTIGIGFQQEEDHNTNFAFAHPAEEILDHIRKNKGEEIPDARCLKAIRLLQEFAAEYLKHGRDCGCRDAPGRGGL